MSREIAKPDTMRPNARLDLRPFTPARVSLGQVGPAIPTREQLRFQLDHALARDAVHAKLDVIALERELRQIGIESITLRSAATGTELRDRKVYLRRPDLGRKLHENSARELKDLSERLKDRPNLAVVIVDGLSAVAVERHAAGLLEAVTAEGLNEWKRAPVFIVTDGRVAIGDEIGAILEAQLAIVLIGERPGLSSPDSLGVYLTWEPRPGRTDAERNCISNIRIEGLSYHAAARRLVSYVKQARRLRMTGVYLKERSEKLIGG